MSKRMYSLVFAEEKNARAAQELLRAYGQVVLGEEEDDHERVYRLTLTSDGIPPTPYEIDRIALHYEGHLDPPRAA